MKFKLINWLLLIASRLIYHILFDSWCFSTLKIAVSKLSIDLSRLWNVININRLTLSSFLMLDSTHDCRFNILLRRLLYMIKLRWLISVNCSLILELIECKWRGSSICSGPFAVLHSLIFWGRHDAHFARHFNYRSCIRIAFTRATLAHPSLNRFNLRIKTHLLLMDSIVDLPWDQRWELVTVW